MTASVKPDAAMPHVTPKQAPDTGGAQARANRDGGAATFGEKLRTLEEKAGASAQPAVGERRGPQSQKKLFEDDRQGPAQEGEVFAQSLMVGVDAQRLAMTAVAPEIAAQSALPDLKQAHLERMAAAIAEAVGKGGDQVATIDFGSDMGLVKSAIIARDAAGMISITMVTPNATLAPLAWTALRNQLSDRLEKRKIGVKSIDLEDDEIRKRVLRQQ